MEIIAILSTVMTMIYLVSGRNRNAINSIIFLSAYLYIALTNTNFFALLGIILFLLSEYTIIRVSDKQKFKKNRYVSKIIVLVAVLILSYLYYTSGSTMSMPRIQELLIEEKELSLSLLVASTLLIKLLEKKWKF